MFENIERVILYIHVSRIVITCTRPGTGKVASKHVTAEGTYKVSVVNAVRFVGVTLVRFLLC